MYYPSVKNVVVGENFMLSIDFDNGEQGILDMKPFLDSGDNRATLYSPGGLVWRLIVLPKTDL